MDTFEKAVLIENPEKEAALMKTIMEKFPLAPKEVIEAIMADTRDCETYINDTYTVYVKDAEKFNENSPDMLWLSIKRNDRQPIHDWRDLQEIKNQIVGEEHEAVELYPSQDRVVDTANQYHLWVFKDKKFRFPFGFKGGYVDYDMAAKSGGVQRPK